MHAKTILLAAALSLAPGILHAQFDFNLAGRAIQVHSSASQGFAYSNENNYLTMQTSDGSFAFTDAGANISMQVSDKFRVGAQFYLRNIGNLGNFRPEVDWALGDYKFANWFGVRAGKVKTTLGLYNDTQDLEFLHTWAILPQSAYPLDLRASTIAHTGGDVYGTIPLKLLGSISYVGYAGSRSAKVKTTLGLYNDTQDLEFLHTWAILPQSAYPLDLRASTIAHTGGLR